MNFTKVIPGSYAKAFHSGQKLILTDKWVSNTFWCIARGKIDPVELEKMKKRALMVETEMKEETIEPLMALPYDAKKEELHDAIDCTQSRPYVRVTGDSFQAFDAYYMAFMLKVFEGYKLFFSKSKQCAYFFKNEKVEGVLTGVVKEN